MSISAEKLQRLRKQSGVPVATVMPKVQPASETMPMLRRMLGVRQRTVTVRAAESDRQLPGVELSPGLRVVEHLLPWTTVPAQFDGSFARSEPLPSDGMLFFDTETTGLSGGTGTRAFMIGASDFVPGGLRIRQLLISHLAAETAMLEAFSQWLRPDTRLVSYNGRCYDAPLLATRYRLARKNNPLPDLAHLDLLFPTRRRYRGVWENCKLATIERNALGIVREDDLPGSEAPAAWLQYLRGGSSHLLQRVLAHNFQDVVTLARLLEHLAVVDVGEAVDVGKATEGGVPLLLSEAL
jgi:uncharacterized protein YprB with RNaseH-like and TPR domain